MSKSSIMYVCSKCDAQFPKWNGRCSECGGWGTLSKRVVDSEAGAREKPAAAPPAEVVDFSRIDAHASARLKTGIGEFDRVLGGGFVPGSLILLSGEPGIGKSTIVAQVMDAVAKAGGREGGVIYVSGEESPSQVKTRLDRLHCDTGKIALITETNAEKIASAVDNIGPALVVIDSIQTVYSREIEAEAGGLNQIRACTVKLLEIAKRKDIVFILVGHITKDGSVAGPKALEHIVDTVIYLETEARHNYRILRATKNRFGSVNELGVFEMTGAGFKEIKNPAAIFLETSEQKITGSVISCIMEGTRPFLVEIQALVTKTVFGYPQRKASGFDSNRLQVLAAVLTKRVKVNLTNQDIILNIVGGLRASDPGLDLAVCLAITSSLLNQVIDRKTIVLGEVGLGGEVRNVSKLKERLAEAEKLGFIKAIVPNMVVAAGGLKIEKVKNLGEVIECVTHNT